jgi:hypothetical protein
MQTTIHNILDNCDNHVSYRIYMWYKPEGRGIGSPWGYLNFSTTLIVTMALGLTQSLTEMSTRNISWKVKAAGA